MKEKFESKLKRDEKSVKKEKEKFELILEKAGMPEKIRRQKFGPMPISSSEALYELLPKMKIATLENFMTLSLEDRDFIRNLFEKRMREGLKRKKPWIF